MPKQVIISCDICGTQKKDVNHWFYGQLDSTGFTIVKNEIETDDTIYICGQDCAHKALDKFLGKSSAIPVPVLVIPKEDIPF